MSKLILSNSKEIQMADITLVIEKPSESYEAPHYNFILGLQDELELFLHKVLIEIAKIKPNDFVFKIQETQHRWGKICLGIGTQQDANIHLATSDSYIDDEVLLSKIKAKVNTWLKEKVGNANVEFAVHKLGIWTATFE